MANVLTEIIGKNTESEFSNSEASYKNNAVEIRCCLANTCAEEYDDAIKFLQMMKEFLK